MQPASADLVETRWATLAPLAPRPAVVRGSFTVLAVAAIVAALMVQGLLVSTKGVAVGPTLAVSVLAIMAGLVGAKSWYMALQRRPWRETITGGWSVDGFLIAGPLVGVVGFAMANVPVGVVLDATAPGMFLAVFIGRLGCFLTGCCAGSCTTSRWGIWSSDRRVGARRIPTQLLESAAGLVLALTTAVLVTSGVLPIAGAAFTVSLLAYVVIRQGVLRLRAERREYSWKRTAVTRGAAGAN